MRRLLLLLVFAVAAWYGWKHYKDLRQPPGNEVVVQNGSGMAMERVRITIGGEPTIRDAIEPGASTTVPFHAAHDGVFDLQWNFRGREAPQDWSGGSITSGPVRMRHHLTVDENGGVVWSSERILEKAPRRP